MISSYFLHSTIRFHNDGNEDEEEQRMATKLIDDTVRFALGRSFSSQPAAGDDDGKGAEVESGASVFVASKLKQKSMTQYAGKKGMWHNGSLLIHPIMWLF